MDTQKAKPGTARWIYPLIYVLFVVLSFLPLRTDVPYSSLQIREVLVDLFKVSLEPYKTIAPLFHVVTLLLVFLIFRFGTKMGRVLAAYMGLDFIVIALTQTMGTTENYGFVIHTGSLVLNLILGVTWLVVAFRGDLKSSLKPFPLSAYLLMPLALLAFWSPYDAQIKPLFDPLLLLTSPDYGMSFCFTVPVFLYLLILFYPNVNGFAYRITAFNGLLYGLLNMQHFFTPGLQWMGVLHLPLLMLSIYALILPRISRGGSMQAA